MSGERDQLFGLLAAQRASVDQARLQQALETMPRDAPGSVADWLVKKAVISPQDRADLDALVEATITAHGGDAAATIQSLQTPPEFVATISASAMAEQDPQRTAAMDTRMKAVLGGAVEPGNSWAVPAVEEHEGRYQTLRDFASGGMGKIILVHDRHIGRDIALKTLLTDKFGTATRTGAPTAEMLTVPIIARFLQEARVTGQLEHPSIIPVYELGYRADGSLYYTMKFVRGKTLQDVLKESPSLAERLPLLNHFLNLCQAIAYAHDRGVVHRDLKPLNVMVGEFGETVVIDWGIAKVRGQQDIHARNLRESIRTLHIGEAEATAKTVYGQTIGSPYYMPPEQAQGRMDEIDERSDVYALGALLYHILAGKPPYAGSTVREFLTKVVDFDPRPVREVEPAAPRELAAICQKAMQRKRENRYPSAKELADEISKYLAGGLVSAYDYRFSELFWRFVKKHRRVLTTAGIAAVLLVTLGVYSYVSVTQQRNLAVAARILADEQRTNAQRELYFANIALTQRSIEEQQMAAARQLLEQCPEPFRQWEWGYLQCQSNADLMTLRHGGRYAQFLPDGVSVLTGRANGTVARCDLGTGEPTHTFIDRAGLGYAMAWSADGARAAVSGEKSLAVWDTATGQELLRFDEPAKALSRNFVAMSADGKRVGALGSDRKARIWELGVSQPILTLPVQQAQGFGLYFSPDASRLLVTRADFGDNGWERIFEVLSLPSGEVLGKDKVRDPLSVHAAAFSPDGAHFALGTDEGLQVWAVDEWRMLHEFPARFGHPDTVAFSPDGSLLAAGTVDGDVGLWDIATGEGTFLRKAHTETVRAVTFSHHGQWLATVSFDRTAKLWQAPGLRPLRTFRGHDKSLFAVAFSPDDGLLATGAFDGNTKLWDLRAEVEFAPAERMIYHPGRGWLVGAMQGQVVLWDAHTGHRVRAFEGHNPPIKVLAFDAPGTRLATVCNEPAASGTADVARVWNAETGELLLTMPDLPAGVSAVAFGGGALALHAGTNLSLRDAATGAELWNVPKAAGFIFSPNGERLAVSSAEATGSNECTITVFDLAAKTPAATHQVATNWLASLAFSPDGNRLFIGAQTGTGSDTKGPVYTWDIAADASGPTLEGHQGQVTCMAFSPDGALLATGSKDSTFIVWDAATGTRNVAMTGHSADILDLAFSPDGKRLVTACQDGFFKLWDTENGRDILTLQASARSAEGQVVQPARVAFSPDARQLITITDPVFAPIVLHAFPWDLSAYPGAADAPLPDRVEQYKRNYWK
jgi:WD40 repeat protein/serine/threonine protein kinase